MANSSETKSTHPQKGKQLDSEDENLAELNKQAHLFLDEKLEVYREAKRAMNLGDGYPSNRKLLDKAISWSV